MIGHKVIVISRLFEDLNEFQLVLLSVMLDLGDSDPEPGIQIHPVMAPHPAHVQQSVTPDSSVNERPKSGHVSNYALFRRKKIILQKRTS